jgi:hypothetical protein
MISLIYDIHLFADTDNIIKECVELEMDWKLLVIKQMSKVGTLAHYGEVYKIERVAAISLSHSETRQLELDVSYCP